jgi:hypothetical protein
MTTITLDLPEELVQQMTMASDEDWSTIGKAFGNRLKRLAIRVR